MVEPDYSPEHPTFTPLPVYESMKAHIAKTRSNPVLYPGVHQAETWQAVLTDSTEILPDDIAQFKQVVSTNEWMATVSATDVMIRWLGQLPDHVQFEADNVTQKTIEALPSIFMSRLIFEDDWAVTHLYLSSQQELHTIRVYSDTPFFIDSITVMDRSFENTFPLIAPIAAVGAIALGVIASALWKRVRG
jgi:hypothetical protein